MGANIGTFQLTDHSSTWFVSGDISYEFKIDRIYNGRFERSPENKSITLTFGAQLLWLLAL